MGLGVARVERECLPVTGDGVEHQPGVALRRGEVEPGQRVGLLRQRVAVEADGLGEFAARLQ